MRELPNPNKIVTMLVTACLALALAAVTTAAEKSEKLFGSDQVLKVEIEAPWRKLIRKKSDKRWPATLVMTDSSGETHRIALTVERRGISRQKVCDFPPIRLRFDKDSVEGTLFDGEGALKLVTHCDDGERWTQYYVLEMLAYQIYNLITDYSFRVRELEVLYTDIDRNREPDPKFGFVIEDVDELADRHGLKELDFQRVSSSRLERTTMSQLALFEFMIGNLDWSALTGPGNVCCHNIKMIGTSQDAETVIPVPYDFDSTGFVDAHYALPPDKLPVRSVRTRLYRGYCIHNDTMPAARKKFLDAEADIMSLVRKEPELNKRSREGALDYLNDFFDILKSDEAFEESVTSKCRG